MVYSGAFAWEGVKAAVSCNVRPRRAVPTTVASSRWRAVEDEGRAKSEDTGWGKGDGAPWAGRWPCLTGPPSTGPHPWRPGEDENLDGHARATRWKHRLRGRSPRSFSLPLPLILFLFPCSLPPCVLVLVFVSFPLGPTGASVASNQDVFSSFGALASLSSIKQPSGSNPFLLCLLLLILVRVSSRFTSEVNPGHGGLYLLRLALQIGRSKKISLKKCQYSYTACQSERRW